MEVAPSGQAAWSGAEEAYFVDVDSAYRFRAPMTITDLNPPGTGFHAVWSTSDDEEIYLVGSGGAIRRYANNGWATMTSPTTTNLNAIWGAGRDDIWSVGDDGVVVHFDGSKWRTIPVVPSTTSRLLSVWGSGQSRYFSSDDGIVRQIIRSPSTTGTRR